jgi:transcriptional regulator with XRE-family HTH domain
MRTMAEFGARVRALRQQRGADQEVIARALGYAVSARNSPVSELERGQLNLSLAKIFKLAEVLEVTPAELFATPGAREPAAPAPPVPAPSQAGFSEADRQLVERVMAFLAEAGPDLRRRLTDHMEALEALKDTRQPQGGGAGAG